MLALFAHPDDEAFPVGGALAAHAARGVEIRLVTTTSGEEGEIRQDGAATRETLGSIRRVELSCAVQALGLAGHRVLGYRDSGMAGTESNSYPNAYINVPDEEMVEQLVEEIRQFQPQVVLTFEPGGLYGHPDHIAISRQATEAVRRSGEASAFPHQLTNGLEAYAPARLFYSARPKGFRMEWAQALRNAGIDFPLPSPERAQEGTPANEIHLEMDLDSVLERKMACILCHRTQVAADWPYHRVSRDVTRTVLGREYYIRAFPQVEPSETVTEDFFAGLTA
jgi:LmbE family N-acetylglucosaminyl deacetylase